MIYKYRNITNTDATLLSPTAIADGGSGDIIYDSISILNTSASYNYSVDLYITRTLNNKDESRQYVGQAGPSGASEFNTLGTTTNTYYLIKTVKIPVGATLVLEKNDLVFDVKKYDLYIKVNDITGSGVTVDVNMNLKGSGY